MQEKTSRRGDMLLGSFWVVFGTAVAIHSIKMPVPRHLGATFLTSPGLVPALLGGALVLLGIVLCLRSLRGSTILSSDEDVEDPRQLSALNPLIALVIMVGYAVTLMLRQPFVPWTILFITLFVVVFNWSLAASGQQKARLVAGALALAVCTAFAVQFVFEDLFYVRLP